MIDAAEVQIIAYVDDDGEPQPARLVAVGRASSRRSNAASVGGCGELKSKTFGI
jgi:hypothetical protein